MTSGTYWWDVNVYQKKHFLEFFSKFSDPFTLKNRNELLEKKSTFFDISGEIEKLVSKLARLNDIVVECVPYPLPIVLRQCHLNRYTPEKSRFFPF